MVPWDSVPTATSAKKWNQYKLRKKGPHSEDKKSYEKSKDKSKLLLNFWISENCATLI